MSEKKPPERIYLQDWESPNYEDTTWCVDSISNESPDIEYIRADLVTKKEEQIRHFKDALHKIDLVTTRYPKIWDSVREIIQSIKE